KKKTRAGRFFFAQILPPEAIPKENVGGIFLSYEARPATMLLLTTYSQTALSLTRASLSSPQKGASSCRYSNPAAAIS
ncbi:MAG: hypothetical protein R3256_13780, partial [Thalassovita sp.]|nr:hypothetical protein [Thalassovita sp.]